MARILAIDDEPDIRSLWRLYLEQAGHDCIIVNGAAKAIEVLKHETPDLIVTDIMMPGLSGGEVYEWIRQECGPRMPVIISSAKNLKFRETGDPFLAICSKQEPQERLVEVVDELLEKVRSGA
jgi:CheY-like chemotaxis protein